MAWSTFGTGTGNTGGLRGQRNANANIREDLSNMISNIDRDETPFLSSIGTNKATGPLHEWLTDTYQDPSANRQGEGFTFASGSVTQNARTRLNNRTQIFGKHIIASGSTISSDVAGVANEFAYQLKKNGVELRRDIEYQQVRYVESGNATSGAAAVKAAASGTGSGGVSPSATAGQLGSVYAYTSHYVNAANGGTTADTLVGSSATANNLTAGIVGVGTSAAPGAGADAFVDSPDGSFIVNFGAAAPIRTAGATQQATAFSRDQLERLLTNMFNEGGKPSVAQIPSGLKTSVSAALISGSDGAAQRRADEMAKKLNIAVMGVMTDFGFDISLVPNYIMNMSAVGSNKSILVYDPKMVKRAILTPMATEEDRVARYGRAAIMYCEETLEVMNPHAVGAIVGIL